MLQLPGPSSNVRPQHTRQCNDYSIHSRCHGYGAVSSTRLKFRWVCAVVFSPTHLRRTLRITVVVGLALNLFNDGRRILHGPWSGSLAAKIIFNFCMPFLVANLGLLAHRISTSTTRISRMHRQ